MGRVGRFQRRGKGAATKWRRGNALNLRKLLLLTVVAGGALGFLLFESAPGLLAGQADWTATSPTTGEGAIAGRASVIDGDTLDIHGIRIRLHGIDAPEAGQLCLADVEKWRCGQGAALALSDKIGSAAVGCEERDVDRYGRIVAVCYAQGADLNAWMVASGWALAYRQYSRDYVQQEETAAVAMHGIWQGVFVPPWEWRRGKRLATEEVANAGGLPACDIKGNVSSSGERIYHVPGGEHYSRTKIRPSRGERWFCSEAEAQAAGWRRSKR